MARRALLLIGGNMGNRLSRLRAAVRALDRLPGCRVARRSRVYETSPVGPSKRPYLNAVVLVDTSISPMGLLVECKRVEVETGRRPGQRWAARPLDVDILFMEGVRLKTNWLEVPHPLINQRPFVLAPLKDVAPRLVPRSFRLPPASVKLYPHGL